MELQQDGEFFSRNSSNRVKITLFSSQFLKHQLNISPKVYNSVDVYNFNSDAEVAGNL